MTADTHGNGPPAAARRASGLLQQTAQRRGLGWRRLAEAWYGPAGTWIAELLAGDVEADLARSVAWLDSDRELFTGPLAELRAARESLAETGVGAARESAEVEYARLFIGPGEVPAQPYESVWMDADPNTGDRTFGGASTAAVEAAYATYGLEPDPSHHDLPDHIATEQEFLCYLCEREAAAWADGDSANAKRIRAAEQEFLTGHLTRFAPRLCAAVRETAPGGIYAGFAGFLLAFLTVESGTSYVEVVRSTWASPQRS